MRSVFVHGKTWFDKSGGVSYFSARIFADGRFVAPIEFQNGYGDQYLYAAQRKMQELGLLTKSEQFSFRAQLDQMQYRPALYTVLESVTKRECIGWGNA